MDRSNYLNLSNTLSFVRIFLAVPIYLYLAAEENIFALAFIVIAVVTDFLDGYFARRNNEVTDD